MLSLMKGRIISLGTEKFAIILISSSRQLYISSSFRIGFLRVKAARNPLAMLNVLLLSGLFFFFVDFRF